MGPLVCQQLKDLGVPDGYLKQLVITHAHPDHVMAVPALCQAYPGISVMASQPAAGTLGNEKAVSFFCKMDDQLAGVLTAAGSIGPEHRRPPMSENVISVDRVLQADDTIAVDDNVSFRVLETPGHSDCSLSFHEPAANVLIISDATGFYMPEHQWWWPNYFTDYGAYLDSIQRLAAVGAEVLCLSHNGAFRGAEAVTAYLHGAIAATEAYHARIVDLARSGKSVREIAGALGEDVYAKTQLMPLEFFQKNCSILVKNSLRHEEIEAE
jgi:glyoxylase-like metal-dependent hydrolase (beta-lactamase superfamily II)